MIEQLATVEEPEWLSGIDSKNFRETPFPLTDILQCSLYYPAADFDVDPVRYLAGNVVSFVYVDYAKSEEELARELADPSNGFRGYELIASRPVTEKGLTPNGRNPLFPSTADGAPSRHRKRRKNFFCSWNILQRLDNFPEGHGPHRFSLLYLCEEGVAAFQALYVANRASPAIVAVIQPGRVGKVCCDNWTNFEDPEEIFARTVTQNPWGKPKVLLFGGIGPREFYHEPCWPDYSELVCFLDKKGKGSIGVWRLAQQHAADAADAER